MTVPDELRSKLPGGDDPGEQDGRKRATWVSPNRLGRKGRRTPTEAVREREQKIRRDSDLAARLGVPYVPPGT